MIKLFQFPPMYGIPNASPFCMKLESYFRAQGLEYENHYTLDPRQSPTHKLPFIEYNGKRYADSGFIIAMLEKESQTPMQAALSDKDKADTLAYLRLCENNLYWLLIYSRWIDSDYSKHWQQMLIQSSKMPVFIFKIICKVMVKNVTKQLDGHGVGRMAKEEVYGLAQQDLQALSVFLGNKRYFFHDSPTLLDHVVYSLVTSIAKTPWNNQLTQILFNYPNLMAQGEAMLVRFFNTNES